ncbi:double-strand break repair helicase AddA [Devosia sp. ZB163]|uniref:double-strand break repair helicase AddA n=1 Tax=Devosia sp. ZB163 TaxID=3025938 RepID=UPI00235FFE6C|nr:double-strand break repair helicase AddA [Devosia sp. ZB163]MDC9822916.1 double-strand break repair helicase AddA [Devosia sp. ZB163]
MSRRLRNPMPDAIVVRQRDASDPERSVWVTANAGSGKTYVLTARVLRLLLSGARPEEILCLTYTKAAAAEMRGRVAERLGKWALASDEDLVRDLTSLSGAPPTPAMRLRARSLFARALEAPGGLRIQTIHAFCESVLHRFPREAAVPFDFSVLEQHERDAMLLEARETVIAAGLRGSGEAGAVETLFGLLSDFSIEQSILEALNQQRTLRRVLARPDAARRELRKLVGNVGSIDEVMEEIASGYGLSRADHDEIFRLVRPDPNGTDFVDRLGQIDPDRPDAGDLLDTFLTQADRTARKTLIKKATAALIPDVAARVVAEGARLEQLNQKLVAAELIARSEAMLAIVAAISAHYERAKRARSLLDFDDLIEKLAALLKDEALGQWVRYKLDAGISHILVDEGQDTNPQQWEVIGALVDDFFFGESAADRPRTLFAVGDQKQSIFSFQGADPEVFVDAGRKYAFSAKAAHFEITQVPLRYSFRTLPNVLKAVDEVFRRPDLKAGALEDDGMLHDTARAEGGGTVTLWPPIKDQAEDADPDNWPTVPPLVATQSAQRLTAERIAREIRQWIVEKRPLGPRGRPVRADDVLILVQVRSVLFHEIIRALIGAGIPTPGADRLAVTTHIGVLDMMALGDVLSNPADDLQLAALLRSPLFDVSEEDLLAVAQPRSDKERLWWALEKSDIRSVRAAYEQLKTWRSRLDFDRPFNFYADVLYAGGGLRRMRGRFGSEIDDVMAEFLDLALQHEQSPQPSLLGFLAELRSREVTIKRELAEAGAGVRVMTVHGAKGLEAPIVILADAATTERGRDRRSVYLRAEPPLFIHASSKDSHVPETMEHKEQTDEDQQREYWRKLYVAMTRAEDELYVTGYLTKQGKVDGSWYEAIEQGLAPLSETVADADGKPVALVYPSDRPAPEPARSDEARGTGPGAELVLPPLAPHRPRRVLRPSSLESSAAPEKALATRLEEGLDPETARKSGTALHALLQHLAKVAPADRKAVADRALMTLLPDAPAQHEPLATKAISILSRPELAHLFGPNSRAEVPFLARAIRNGEPVTIAGRIDRLIETENEILLVDFKSDANPVLEPQAIRGAYLSQLAVYAFVASQLFPGRTVNAAILWTSLESLVKLPTAALADAVGGFTVQ